MSAHVFSDGTLASLQLRIPIAFRNELLLSYLRPLEAMSFMSTCKQMVQVPRPLAYKLGLRAQIRAETQYSRDRSLISRMVRPLLHKSLEWPGLSDFGRAEMHLAELFDQTYEEEMIEMWGITDECEKLDEIVDYIYESRDFWAVFRERNPQVPLPLIVRLRQHVQSVQMFSSEFLVDQDGEVWQRFDRNCLLLYGKLGFLKFSLCVREDSL